MNERILQLCFVSYVHPFSFSLSVSVLSLSSFYVCGTAKHLETHMPRLQMCSRLNFWLKGKLPFLPAVSLCPA